MTRRRTPDQWRREVLRSRTLKDHTKVVLIFLADNMRSNLRVSVPRSTVAREVGKSERSVTRSVTEAHRLGFLDTVVHGRKGLTAVYAACFPDDYGGARPTAAAASESAPPTSGTFFNPLVGVTVGPLMDGHNVDSETHGGPPLDQRTSPAVPTDRNESSNEEAPRADAGGRLPRCPWHEGTTGGPEDCTCTPAVRWTSA